MTWSFLFLTCFLVGLVMAATSGLLRRFTVHRLCQQITLPAPEHHSALVNLIARRASFPLAAFGAVGLVLLRSETTTRLIAGAVGALLATVVAIVVLREWWSPPPPPVAAIVARAIPPNGFGQIEIEQGGRTVVLAARSADGQAIAAGAAVEMVDCQSSVMTVRQLTRHVTAA